MDKNAVAPLLIGLCAIDALPWTVLAANKDLTPWIAFDDTVTNNLLSDVPFSVAHPVILPRSDENTY